MADQVWAVGVSSEPRLPRRAPTVFAARAPNEAEIRAALTAAPNQFVSLPV
jgi:hypothetical protein